MADQTRGWLFRSWWEFAVGLYFAIAAIGFVAPVSHSLSLPLRVAVNVLAGVVGARFGFWVVNHG